MEKIIEFIPLLQMVQEHISTRYSAALTDKEKQSQLKSYINQFLLNTEYTVRGYSMEELCDKLFTEMAEFSVLTPLLGRTDLEEINVNAWDDIAITYTTGRIEKLAEHFYSPQHAIDIVKRLLHHSGMIIDNTAPMAQGHLPNNTRITALKTPIVDDNVGIAVSIRLLHPYSITKEQIIKYGTGTEKMIDFLCYCMRYGVSLIVAGATSSGKTTLLNAILGTIPNEKRVYTIESGARELALVKKDAAGRICNNVVHTLSRPSDNDTANIAQEDLVVASLRFNPDIICVGEIRDVEAYSAVEASLTGHTVVSTVHATAQAMAHMRIALLTQKKFPIDFGTSLMQAGQAFPLVVYAHKLEDNSRRIMDISECEILPNGERIYHTLYRYVITKNIVIDGKYHIEGHFEQVEQISESLKRRLLQFGIPQDILEKFLTEGAEY